MRVYIYITQMYTEDETHASAWYQFIMSLNDDTIIYTYMPLSKYCLI